MKKDKYRVAITEKKTKIFEVVADSRSEALGIVSDGYWNDEYPVEDDYDVSDTEFEIL